MIMSTIILWYHHVPHTSPQAESMCIAAVRGRSGRSHDARVELMVTVAMGYPDKGGARSATRNGHQMVAELSKNRYQGTV